MSVEITPEAYDRDLESRMDSAALRLAFSPDAADRRRAMDELQDLKRAQRPERIAELERQRGLR